MPSRVSCCISKRSKAVALTVAELRNVLSRHDDDSKIDEIGEVDVLRQVFNVLRKKFHLTTTQSNRDALRIRKLDVTALQIPDAVVAALPGWLENLWTFWGSWTLHSPAFDSSFNGERAMSYSDVRVTTKFLRSHHITKWLETSGSGQNAIRLLDFPVHDTFLELSNSRYVAGTATDRLEGIITASRVTRQEPEITTVSIASRQRGHLALSTNAPYTRQEHGTTPEATTNKLMLHAGSLPAATDAVTHGRMQRGIAAVTPDGAVECPLAPLSLGAGGSPESIRRAQCAPLLEFSALSDGFGSDWQWEPEAIGPYVQDVRQDRYC